MANVHRDRLQYMLELENCELSTQDDHAPFPWTSSSQGLSTTLNLTRSTISWSRVDLSLNSPGSIKDLKGANEGLPSTKNESAKKRRTNTDKWMDVFDAHAKTIPELMDLQQEAENLAPGRIIFQLPGL